MTSEVQKVRKGGECDLGHADAPVCTPPSGAPAGASAWVPGGKLGSSDRLRQSHSAEPCDYVTMSTNEPCETQGMASRAGQSLGLLLPLSPSPRGLVTAEEQKRQAGHAVTPETCAQNGRAVTSAKASPKVKGQRQGVPGASEAHGEGHGCGRSEGPGLVATPSEVPQE